MGEGKLQLTRINILKAAKLKLRELALKFKKTDKPDVKYAYVCMWVHSRDIIPLDL